MRGFIAHPLGQLFPSPGGRGQGSDLRAVWALGPARELHSWLLTATGWLRLPEKADQAERASIFSKKNSVNMEKN